MPFKPWFDAGILLFGPALGVLAPFVFVAAFTLLMMSRPGGGPGDGAEAVVHLLYGLSAGVPAPADQHFQDAAAVVPARPRRRDSSHGPAPTAVPWSPCSCCCRSSGLSGCGRGPRCRAAATIRRDARHLSRRALAAGFAGRRESPTISYGRACYGIIGTVSKDKKQDSEFLATAAVRRPPGGLFDQADAARPGW